MESGGQLRIRAVYYDGTNIRVESLQAISDVPRYLQVHSGAQLWIDVKSPDVDTILKELDIADPGPGPIIHEERDPAQTVIAFTHTCKGTRRQHRTVVAVLGADVLFSVHDSSGPYDSKEVMLEYIPALVEKELSGVPKAILYFRNMLLAALLDTQADEYISTLQDIVRELSRLQQRLDSGEVETNEVQTELVRVHMYVEDEFPTALLSFREVVAKLRMSAGKNIDLKDKHRELEDVLADVDGAVAIKANVEKTIDLVGNTIRVKLSERTLDSQRRLQQAVWILTHLSVVLIIPTLVLNFWRLTPWVHDTRIDVGGYELHAFWLSLVVTALFTLVGLVALNAYLRRLLGGSIQEAFDET